MDVLRPVVRPYAWGSRNAIADLQGRPVPSAGPEAELWMGAHPSAPAVVAGTSLQTLDAVIAADPAGQLGAGCVARFGPRLPFLLKVLAAEQALSIQVHPSRAQAQAGFAAENARGLAPDDPARNYTDDWPKPELLYALTPFEVLAGLRRPADAAALLRALAVARLAPLADQLESAVQLESAAARLAAPPDPGSPAGSSRGSVSGSERGSGSGSVSGSVSGQVLAGLLGTILRWPPAGRPAFVAEVVAACARLASAGGPYSAAAAAAVRIAAGRSGDLGVVASLLMRHAVLEPGQAMYMAAGGLHAYLQGTGIELLANSDNVVRAGLTGKHVDVPELLALLDPAVPVPVLSPRVLADGIACFDTPAPEFRLYLVDLVGHTVWLPGEGPRIVLCTQGSVVLRSERGESTEIGRGGSCFISAADGAVSGTGTGYLFLASPGLP